MYYKYKIFDNKLITKNVRLLTLIFDDVSANPLLHQPGQYAAIVLNDRSRPTPARCFSIASSPNLQRTLQFSIRVNGLFTSALERLKKGDEVLVRGPFGNFIFNENLHKDVVMFAGGIGVAPFMSMIRYASRLELKNKIHLIYSCRTEDDIPFFEKLVELEQTNPYLKVTYVIASGPTSRLNERNVLSGRLTSLNVEKLALSYSRQIYMICGPSAYMTAINSILKGKGVPQKNILTEAFSQGGHQQTDSLKRWPFNMYALTSLSLVISGFLITASDLYKTFPQLNSNIASSQVNTNSNTTSGNLLDKLNAIGPQVNTNIKQSPIIKYKQVNSVSGSTNPVAVAPSPATIAPAPRPTVVPTVKPKSRVS